MWHLVLLISSSYCLFFLLCMDHAFLFLFRLVIFHYKLGILDIIRQDSGFAYPTPGACYWVLLIDLFRVLTGLFEWSSFSRQCTPSGVTPQMQQSRACTQSPRSDWFATRPSFPDHTSLIQLSLDFITEVFFVVRVWGLFWLWVIS